MKRLDTPGATCRGKFRGLPYCAPGDPPSQALISWAKNTHTSESFRDAACAAALMMSVALPATAEPSANEIALPYTSVSQAYHALSKREHATLARHAGWTLISLAGEKAGQDSVWSFVPTSHAAYPAVVIENRIVRDGEPELMTRLLCESTRAACDALVTTLDSQLPSRTLDSAPVQSSPD